MNNHKDLDVWKRSIEFVKVIYMLTSSFPKEEMYGLTNQIRRAAVSISANIAEGAGRNHKAEFKQFLYISLGSQSELETEIIIAKELGYIDNNIFEQIENDLIIIGKMLLGLIRSISKAQITDN